MSDAKRVLVIGASGMVGRGIVRMAVARGWTVAAAARGRDGLDQCAADAGGPIETVLGDLASDAGARRLFDQASGLLGSIDAVVVSVSLPMINRPLLETPAADVLAQIDGNVLGSLRALQAMLPQLAPGSVFLGIGGGMADFIVPGYGPVAMSQAAMRNMFRMVARENRGHPVHLRELLVASMVNGHSNRDSAAPEWLTDDEIGRHVCAILAEPEKFTGPVLTLRTREEIGVAGAA